MMVPWLIAQTQLDPFAIVWGIVKSNPWVFVALFVMMAVAAIIPEAKRRTRRRRSRRRASVARESSLSLPSHAQQPDATSATIPGTFEAAAGLLTPTEAAFHRTLHRLLRADHPDGPRILAKVRLADIAAPPRDSPTWQADFNRVQSKHVDFVVVAGPRMLPIRVVELDDASHQRPDRIERDILVDRVLHHAGIPILHVPVERMNDEPWLQRQLGFAGASSPAEGVRGARA